MIDRQQVNLRLEREIVEALDDLARTEHVDRTEVARRILVDGIARTRADRAVRDYAAGRVTAWKAARDAGVSLYEMLDRIHEAGIPYELDPDEVKRLAFPGQSGSRRIAEGRSEYAMSSATREAEADIDELRQRYRPTSVRVLFVGESSPAHGTHFYRANSNLYRATRAAFARALGADAVPTGEAFLRFFRDGGFWLVDLADRPVNRLPGQERRDVVQQGVAALAETIRRERPAHVVTVKRDIVDHVAEAISLAGEPYPSLHSLPFPVRQWARAYEDQLATLLREWTEEGEPALR
ncbi:MAG: UPF0175 family protein [Chloroflexota bacterium]|nr:UPF0175 family protein [Chloroflexota bacterium]